MPKYVSIKKVRLNKMKKVKFGYQSNDDLPLCFSFKVSNVQKLTPAYGTTPNMVGVNPL